MKYRCRLCGAAAPMQEISDPDRPGLIGRVPECPAGHGRETMRRAEGRPLDQAAAPVVVGGVWAREPDETGETGKD